jgi:hypothetical protein
VDWKAERVGINDLYEAFWALSASPPAATIEVFLERVFDEMDECDPDWHEMLGRLRRFRYPGIESFIWRVFEDVPDGTGSGNGDDDGNLAFFAWSASETLAKMNPDALPRLIDVIAARKDTYDADASAHIEEILADARSEDAILRYSESLQPERLSDEQLVPWASAYSTRRLIALRMARIWRERESGMSQPLDLSDVEAKVLAGFTGDDIKLEVARHVISTVFDKREIPLESIGFDMAVAEDTGLEESCALMTGIYRGFLQFGDHCGFQPITAIAHAELLIHSLLMLYDTEQGAENPFDLLEDPAELLEPFIADSSRGLMDINVRRARMLINAFKICCRIGIAHRILNDIDAANAEAELDRLADLLDTVSRQ